MSKFNLFILLFLINFIGFAQQAEQFRLKSKLVVPIENHIQESLFLGLEKIHFELDSVQSLKGKNYKLIIKEYRDGKLFKENLAIDTKEEKMPTIGDNFEFNLITQNILNFEKIAFYFPRYQNKNIFETLEVFQDGNFSLRPLNDGSPYLTFQLNEPLQIALITPPNRDPNKGNLGYCEVTNGNVIVSEWYNKYRIPQFFLVYLVVH